ncbi:MAG: hypothetical protein GWP08_15485 [Nitrospiraceae bacterium]|nr:hypothetical protein [Nitrospiraceae bacterium]
MRRCGWEKRVELWFDGEGAPTDPEAAHVAQCPHCAAQVAQWGALRSAVRETAASEAIADAQFPAFFDGIREQVRTPMRPRGHRKLWAALSLTAAALIVAISAVVVFRDGPQPVGATVIESCSTELEGATIRSYSSDEGVATVWITVSQDDVW